MAKRILTIFVILMLVSGCTVSKITNNNDKKSDSENDLADKSLLNVTVTIPAKWFSESDTEITQDYLDKEVNEKGYISATLNSDGSVTYVMSKSKHNELLESIKDEINKSIKELIDDDSNSIIDIQINDDMTEFRVTLNNNSVTLVESFATLAFDVYGGMYNIFAGKVADNIKTIFQNQSGETIEEYNSSDSNK